METKTEIHHRRKIIRRDGRRRLWKIEGRSEHKKEAKREPRKTKVGKGAATLKSVTRKILGGERRKTSNSTGEERRKPPPARRGPG